MKRMACVLALATGTGLGLSAASLPVLAEPTPTSAASGLQIAIVSNGATDGDQSLVLELSYRNGYIGSIALYIDGTLIKNRPLATNSTHGVIRFELEPTLLPAGVHEVLIKATDLDGNTATATTRLRIVSDENSGPAHLLYPKRNATVQGVVPIEVQVDDSIRKPFVSFFADNDFLELSNYAPFTYNWDSTHYTNGSHIISVDILDGETQAKVKTLTIRVNVNNPGGLTNRQTTTPDLRRNPVSTPIKKFKSNLVSALPHAQFDAPDLDLAFTPIGRAIFNSLRSGAIETTDPAPTRESGSGLDSLPTHFIVPDIQPGGVRKVGPVVDETNPGAFAAPDHSLPPTHFGGTAVSHPGMLALFAMPKSVFPLSHEGLTGGHVLHTFARPRRAGNIAAIPGMDYDSSRAGLTTLRIAAAPALSRATQVHRTLVDFGAVSRRNRGIEVAFDNSRIAFDVPPRVEHGLPLAPFRQIFEHTGGTVQWFGHSKTVRAFNSTREVVFRVGHTRATVNNRAVQIQARPYIDRGRTIVPLSFVRDALDVTVHYDAATGHIRIDSKR